MGFLEEVLLNVLSGEVIFFLFLVGTEVIVF